VFYNPKYYIYIYIYIYILCLKNCNYFNLCTILKNIIKKSVQDPQFWAIDFVLAHDFYTIDKIFQQKKIKLPKIVVYFTCWLVCCRYRQNQSL